MSQAAQFAAASVVSPWIPAIAAGAQALGQAVGGPNVASAWTDARSAFDGSGWTVSTGGSRATGGKSGGLNQSGAITPGAVESLPVTPTYGGSQGDDMLPWLIVAGLALYLIL